MRFVAALVLALIPLASQGQNSRPSFRRRFRYFDDYLQSVNSKEQEFIDKFEEDLDFEGSGDLSDMLPKHKIYGKVPNFMTKKEAKCCALGIMAGDKGYHCYVDFYVARIIARNQNRAHNRKMVSGNGEIQKSKEKLMKMFVQCVSRKRNTFNKCCHQAAIKIPSYTRYDTQKAKQYRERKNRNKK